MNKISWPLDKSFAFTIFDDTDSSTLTNTKPVYDLLQSLGFRTTKSCWVLEPESEELGFNPGSSLADAEYLAWLLQLQKKGFEIGLHNVSSGSSKREKIKLGIDRFCKIFNINNITFANHAGTRDSIYWASSRLSGISKKIYQLITLYKKDKRFLGHIITSEYYWGDIFQENVKYIRNFTFDELNLFNIFSVMPYKNKLTPQANFWFASSDGHEVNSFCKVLTKDKIDKLVAEGGLCIMYTHFANGFVNNEGGLDENFKSTMEYIASLNGWFAPVSEILDHLILMGGEKTISIHEHNKLSRKWLLEKIRKGGTT